MNEMKLMLKSETFDQNINKISTYENSVSGKFCLKELNVLYIQNSFYAVQERTNFFLHFNTKN